MRKLAAAALSALALLLAPAPAGACTGPGQAFLHKTLPAWIPADAIVAEIDFDTQIDLRPNFHTYLRGRVRRMIQGDYSGTALLVRLDQMSCETPFGNGMSGFLVGTPDGMEDGVLVVVPVLAPRHLFESLLGALQLPAYAATHNKS
jgi:hypothetical protein